MNCDPYRAAGVEVCTRCEGRGKLCPHCGRPAHHAHVHYVRAESHLGRGRRIQPTPEKCAACSGTGLLRRRTG